MVNFKNLLSNAMKHITIDGRMSTMPFLLMHLFMVLQIISVIAHPDSDLFKVVKWFDPSNYLTPTFSVITGFSISIIFLLILFVRLLLAEENTSLVKPNTLTQYMGTILLHLQVVCKTVILIPLVRGSIMTIDNPPDSAMPIISVLALIIYLVILFPILVYNFSNTFVLTPQINKKIYYCNVFLLLSVFLIIFAFVNALNLSLMPLFCAFFFVIYMYLITKQPVFAYSHQKIKKLLTSTVAYISLCRVFGAIMGNTQGSILLQIVGIFFFAAFVNWISASRLKKIVESEQPSINQIKLLLFMVGNLEQYLSILQYFIIWHHKKCVNLNCICDKVLNHVSSKDGDLKSDIIWYEFLEVFIISNYSLQQIKMLPESDLRLKINKYQYIVVDLAEIYLFKLNKLNAAYYILSDFRSILQSKNIQSYVFGQKIAIITYYLQYAIYQKYSAEGIANQFADKYMNFQIEFDKYRKFLLKTASKTSQLWQQMSKREPDEVKLLSSIKILQSWNAKIRNSYKQITTKFQKSAEIIQQITNDYFYFVLTISEKSAFHVIQIPKFDQRSRKKEEKIEHISQNMHSFSYSSQTPVCFVSVDTENFGKINGNNSFFNQIMNLQFGKCTSIDDFIIPEMRQAHQIKMQNFIKGDQFSRQHKNGFALNSAGKIVYAKILIQIMPSIAQGLRYAMFLKKLMPQKKIIGIKNKHQIEYQSQSFQNSIETKFQNDPIITYLTPQLQQQIRQKEIAQLIVNEGEFELKYMHEFIYKDISYLFIEVIDKDQIQLQSPGLSNKKSSNKFTREFTKKDQIISKGSIRNQQQNIQNSIQVSDVQEKALKQKQTKIQESVQHTFDIIMNRSERKIVYQFNLIIIVAGLLRIFILVASMLIKNYNQNAYNTAFNTNTNYNNFMLLLGRLTTNFKLLNLYAYQNQSMMTNMTYQQLKNQTNVGRFMDSFVANFDISAVSQNWTTIGVNTDGSYSIGGENNFLAISDNIISPITNLVSLTASNFNFPVQFSAIPKPLTSISSYYIQLISNVLYVHIPGFRNLKLTVMNPILYGWLDNYTPLIILNMALLLVTALWIIWASRNHYKMIMLKVFAYKFMESVSGEIIHEKQDRCLRFINKYTDFTVESKPQKTASAFLYQSRSSKLGKITQGMDDQTQRELQIKSAFNEVNQNTVTNEKIITADNPAENLSKNKKTNPEVIFSNKNILLVFCKYILPCLPIIIYCFVQTGMELNQNQHLNTVIRSQEGLGLIQQDIILIQLYAMEYGVYSSQLQQQQNISLFFSTLINEMFHMEQEIIGNSNKAALPATQDFMSTIYYGDICQTQQTGAFFASKNFFLGRWNQTSCKSISNQILTKGFISSLLNYLQNANTVFLANQNSTAYNYTQKFAYLTKNNFFIDTVNLVNYFNLIIDTALFYIKIDLKIVLKMYTTTIIYTAAFLISWLGLIILYFRKYYLRVIAREITQIHSLFVLISYETVVKNKDLKQKFVENIKEFNLLK